MKVPTPFEPPFSSDCAFLSSFSRIRNEIDKSRLCSQGVGERLLDMTADVSREANAVFGYEDDASSGGEQLG